MRAVVILIVSLALACGGSSVDRDAVTAPPDDVPEDTGSGDGDGSGDGAITPDAEEATDDALEDAEDVPEVGPEAFCEDCDDGLDCTSDGCGIDGVCRHVVAEGFCAIGGKCVEAGFGSQCQVCAPDVDPTRYTALTGGPCDDGDACTDGEQCLGGICRGGTPRTCEAPDACHESLGCQGEEGCVTAPRPDGSVCGAGKVCEDAACIDGDPFPAGAVAFFDRTTCPAGWALAADLVGRTAVAVAGEAVGSTLAEPLASGEDRAHAHTFTGAGTSASVSFAGVAGGGNGLAAAGALAVTATGGAASAGLPYLQLLACEKVALEERGRLPRDVFVFVDAPACPASWAASITGHDRLVVGTPDGGTSGASFGAIEVAAHAHGLNGTIPTPSHGVALASGCCADGFATASGVAVTLTSDEATVVFPTRGLLQCEPPSDPSDRVAIIAPAPEPDAAPPGMVLWAEGAACPAGWSPLEAARGRLLVGAALGGDVGLTVGAPLADREDRTHTHPVTTSTTLARKNIAAANGPNQSGAAFGTVSATLPSAPAASGLRFLQRLACRKDTPQ
ncbi:MAG: hypothetical protein IT385_17850 [Deltaproteobacteria bacterium]|nr:hypothetical protein [Deltaproteobacteria bacterium]